MKNKKSVSYKFFAGLVFFMVFSFFVGDVFSASSIPLPTSQETGLSSGSGSEPILGVIESVTTFVTGIIAVLAILMIVVSGIMYMISRGDQTAIDKAKNMLTYSIIGLVVALLGYVIVYTISVMVGTS